MPCYDPREREDRITEDDRHMMQGGDILCSILRALEKEGLTVGGPPALVQWWAEHKRRDADKKARGW